MYFPYLRGKQFELIALNEISDFLATNKTKVSPIIEPVKDSSTLRKTLAVLKKKKINFNVIINPKVGDMQNSMGSIIALLNQELSGYTNFQIGVILTGKDDNSLIINGLKKYDQKINGLTLIHNAENDNIEKIIALYNTWGIGVKYNVVNLSKTSKRYYRNFTTSTVVELDDYFASQQKNADYKSVDESKFSEEHLFYEKEGFVGFSDFLTIGDNYSESGFLPYAVAIHLSYSVESGKILVKHFVSDSNDDSSDIAGKFAEAIKKLVEWCDATGHNTQAVKTFRQLHQQGHFPGLGTIKKLSIMNHIEVVLALI